MNPGLVAYIGILVAGWFMISEAVTPGYSYNVWINIDELANSILWGTNETLSARLGRWEAEGYWLAPVICAGLDVAFQEDDHCRKAMESRL